MDQEPVFNNVPNKCVIIDGKEVWLSRSVAVQGTVLFQTPLGLHVLLVKRGPGCPDEVGKYCTPCGYIDGNEDGPRGVLREIYEETGIYLPHLISECEVLSGALTQPWWTETNPKHNRENITLRYLVWLRGNELPKTNSENSELDECDEVIWHSVNKLDELEYAWNHKEIIEDVVHMFYHRGSNVYILSQMEKFNENEKRLCK